MRTKNILYSIAFAIVLSFSFLLNGCDFGSMKAGTPSISLHQSSQCLSWKKCENAKKYEIYCNNEFVSIIESNDLESFVYDFSGLLVESGEYEFYVIGVCSLIFGENSDKSNVVKYTYDEDLFEIPIPKDTTINTAEANKKIDFEINGTNISISTPSYVADVDGFELYLYSQTSGLKVVPVSLSNTKTTLINIPSLELKNEIYGIRIGYVEGQDHLVSSDLKYINPDNYGLYTQQVYLFDGYINDMYINDLFELRNLVYYSYIYRISEVPIMISNSLQSVIKNYKGSNFNEKLGQLVADSFNCFLETLDEISISVNQKQTNVWQIEFNFDDEKFLNSNGKPEPELSLQPPSGTYYQELQRDDKFYETCNYTLRINDPKYSAESPYDDFASDKQFLYTEVESSEELYWAVENKITPICKNDSTAKSIYNTAKTVLNSIISNDMTDYEKVLSIFDWICANTQYDHHSLTNNSYNGSAATLTPVYYLEGVFETGFAVCDGYSKAFSLLCNMEGIDCVRVVGGAFTGSYSNGEKQYGGHAWNKVKIDDDPTDTIEGKYYLVDITWTAFQSYYLNVYNQPVYMEEVSSHSYFLVSDKDVIETHSAYSARTRFSYYKAEENYDYYNNTKFTYNDKVYDLVIDSVDDIKSTFAYIFVNDLETFEVVIDYEFIKENYVEETKKSITNHTSLTDMISALVTTMKEKKIPEQYISLNQQYYWSLEVYNNAGDQGIIIVLEQALRVDEVPSDSSTVTPNQEAGHLIKNIKDYGAYGEFDLFVTKEVLKYLSNSYEVVPSNLEIVKALFKPFESQFSVSVSLVELENTTPLDNDCVLYRMIVE